LSKRHVEGPAGLINADGAHQAVLDRMNEIGHFLRDTKKTPTIDALALIVLGAAILANRRGLPTDDTTMRRFTQLLLRRITPIVEEVVNGLKT
jgi:hypothetical protein